MELFLVAGSRPDLALDLFDGFLAEGGGAELEPRETPELDRLGPPLLDRRIVEERVGASCENFMSRGGRLRHIACERSDAATSEAPQDRQKTFRVHRLVERVEKGLLDEGMIRDLAVTLDIFEASDLIGETCGEQVVGVHALEAGRDLSSPAEAQDGQGPGGVPAEARLEQGSVEGGLFEHRQSALRVQEREQLLEREGVHGAEGEDNRVVACGGLELDVEAATEALTERKAESPVDAGAEGRV